MVIFKKNIITFVTFLVTCSLSSITLADRISSISSIILNKNSIEIIISSPTESKSFTLENPNRLVLDFTSAKLENREINPKLPSNFKDFRFNQTDNNLRIVFELESKIKITKQALEKIENGSKIKKIIYFNETESNKASENLDDFLNQKIAEFDSIQTKPIQATIKKKPVNLANKKKKKPVIIIDAGHGGKDPGAIGLFYRTKEKDITLSYAKELQKQLLRTNKYQVFMTRERNIFIPLRKRVEFARKKKGDLFISLHANSSHKKSVSGFSIYTLSEKSSDKQAETLAKKENRADIINGMDFSGASQDIVKTLIDMSQRSSKNHSVKFAEMSIKNIKKYKINSLQNSHRFAGFAVLTAPDMISVLVELGYITNRKEEKLLNSLFYRRKLCKSLTETINNYFSKY